MREQVMMGKKPDYTWSQAELRWLKEMSHKRSLHDDISNFEWLEKHLSNLSLNKITKDVIEQTACKKEDSGVKASTVNRMLALIRSVLNKACKQWEWIEQVPNIRLRKENNSRMNWLTREQASKLLLELPPHLRDMARLALSTGLRESNVRELKWSEIDLINKHIIVPPEKSKNKKALNVPLNHDAIQVIKERIGKHHIYVFTYNDKCVWQCSTRAWRKALKRCGLDEFRWHDLRHTWASWHVQSGTTLQELFELGGWSSFDMVLRYAHLSSKHLTEAANRISGAKMVKPILKVVK